jgi:hypothetical protein
VDVFDLFRACGKRKKEKNENNSAGNPSRRAGQMDGRGKQHARMTIRGEREAVKRGGRGERTACPTYRS